jgi:L,D-transpeptidase catalytic domain
MPPVTSRGIVLAGGLVALALGLPASAVAQDGLIETTPTAPTAPTVERAPGGPARAELSIELKGVKNGKVDVGDRVKANGKVRPFVTGQRVTITLTRKGKAVDRKETFVKEVRGANYGSFKFRSKPLLRAGKHRIRVDKERTDNQVGGSARTGAFSLRYPDLDPGDHGEAVKAFNRLLRKQGYSAPGGKAYSSGTGRAVLAFHKVNGRPRNMNATPGDFAKLALGKGGFKPKYEGAGRHVEVDLSRQVMVLAKGGKAQYTFHVSSGAPATPTIRGRFEFYSRQPGFNAKGMYYSVYFHGGYAIHGYASVPPYPASHGCVRNPIPNSVFIYNWVEIGMPIYVYG